MKREELLEKELNERQLGFCGDEETDTHICAHSIHRRERFKDGDREKEQA